MIEKGHYLRIAEKYGDCASWAIWADAGDKPKSNVGDLRIFDLEENPNMLLQVNRNVVMVGLNISRRIEKKFGNFHDSRPQSQDYKIRYAFTGSVFYGAYMTDVIKDFEQVIAGNVIAFLNKNRGFEEHNISIFRQELNDIQSSDPLIIAFGNHTYNILNKHFKNIYRIINVPHYSMYISKEAYKTEVEKLLNGIE